MKHFFIFLLLIFSVQVSPLFAIHATFHTPKEEIRVNKEKKQPQVLLNTIINKAKGVTEWVVTIVKPLFPGRRKSNLGLWIFTGFAVLCLIAGVISLLVVEEVGILTYILFFLAFYFFAAVIYNLILKRMS